MSIVFYKAEKLSICLTIHHGSYSLVPACTDILKWGSLLIASLYMLPFDLYSARKAFHIASSRPDCLTGKVPNFQNPMENSEVYSYTYKGC